MFYFSVLYTFPINNFPPLKSSITVRLEGHPLAWLTEVKSRFVYDVDTEFPINEVNYLTNHLVIMNETSQVFKTILTTKGRKTGKEHSVWLRAVAYNDKIYFSRHKPDGDWFQNALANPNVKIDFDNKQLFGKALIVTNKKLARKISELKYPGEKRTKEKRVVLEITLCE